MIRELVNRSSSFYARKNKLRGHCIPMFQRAMLLTVVFFFLSVSDSSNEMASFTASHSIHEG